jgi:hypothetical protein
MRGFMKKIKLEKSGLFFIAGLMAPAMLFSQQANATPINIPLDQFVQTTTPYLPGVFEYIGPNVPYPIELAIGGPASFTPSAIAFSSTIAFPAGGYAYNGYYSSGPTWALENGGPDENVPNPPPGNSGYLQMSYSVSNLTGSSFLLCGTIDGEEGIVQVNDG